MDIPKYLKLTAEQRAEAWKRSPPKTATVRDYRDARPASRSDADHATFLKEQARYEAERKAAKREKLEAFKASRPERVAKRAPREGLIDVATIAAKVKMSARDARMMLRKAKIAKPACGWAGDATWAKMIEKVLGGKS